MLSLPHLAIIFVVALVVFGPEKLPELARTMGKYMADFRRMSNEFKGSFDQHMRDLEREAEDRRRAQAPPPAPQPTMENSIMRPADSAPSATVASELEGTTPSVTPAAGIIPSADPRVVPAAPSESREAAAEPGAESAAAPPEHTNDQVTDAHHAS